MNQFETDVHFLLMAKNLSEHSPCSSRKVGAVLVRPAAEFLISFGWNAAPEGSSLCQDPHAGCHRKMIGYKSGEGIEHCPAVHAEQQALLQAGRKAMTTEGSTMYVWACLPCSKCLGMIINAGVKRLVHLDRDDYDYLSGIMLVESGLEVRRIKEEECVL